jgi:hypothetical protein
MIKTKVIKNTVPNESAFAIDAMHIQNDVIVLKMRSAIETAKRYIEFELTKMFPGSQRFTVELRMLAPTSYDVSIFADDVGEYIYYGTAQHSITSNRPMTLGESRFARNVHHPGTRARKDEIEAIVDKAVAGIWLESTVWGF